jgi:hypothetical protein
MAAITYAGTLFNTTAGNKTVTATPAVGDLIVVIAASSGLAGGTTSVSDNQADGQGTYTQISSDFTGFSTTGVLTAWVRNALISAASSTIFTASQAGSSGGGLGVVRISGMSIVGLGAVRGAGGQSSGGAGTTPAPVLLRRVGDVFSGTQAALTTNAIVAAVCNGSNSTTTVAQRVGYTEDFDNGYNSPATGMEICHLASGENASTLTFNGTTATQFASIAVELDASVPQYDYVIPGKADKERILYRQGAVGRASCW